MSIVGELKVLYHLALSPIRGHSHQERLENFYRDQANTYDAFRTHLLKGRRELYASLPVPDGGVWVEMGGGTAANLEYLGERLRALARVYVVDLCAPLLEVAQRRCAERGWENVEVVESEVTTFVPPRPADVVTFSYSLTMIPDWFAALEQAQRILRPDGTLGVVDFYVARKYPEASHARHAWLTRVFWPTWFGLDNVFPNPDHVPYLHRHFEVRQFSEHRTRMRYLPFARVPYYRFVGQKPLVGRWGVSLLGTADQDACQEHQNAADDHLKNGSGPGSVHEPMADPGNHS